MERMTMKSSVCLFSLTLVFLKVLYCEGCWKHEREALLGINNAYFGNRLPWADNIDCCKWDRVECNATTVRVSKLDLSMWDDDYYDIRPWRLNYSHFLVFEDLKILNSSSNYMSGCVGKEVLGLNNLEVLDLSYNPYTDDILSCVHESSSLKALYLGGNIINATSHQGSFSMLINLEVLDMSLCEYSSDNDIAYVLSELPYLKSLYLGSSQLNPRSLHGISKLRTLEILDLTGNNLDESILWSLEKEGFAWPINLQSLGLGTNSFSNDFFSSLSGFGHLKTLDLSLNLLEGSLNISGGLGHLKSLDLSSNQLDSLNISGLALSNLEILDFSNNAITNFVVGQDWPGLKMLEELYIYNNEFKGPLQPYFANLSSLRKLDIYDNFFTGNICSNLARLTSLEYLRFELNQFEIPISFTPFFNHSNLKFIYGDGNKVILDSHSTRETWIPKFQLQVLSLSSMTQTNPLPLPNFLYYQHNLVYMDFSDFKLEGEFPNWLLENNTEMTNLALRNCFFTRSQFVLPTRPLLNLAQIDVYNNALIGQISSNNVSSIFPNLEILDMSMNAIHGSIPPEFGQMNLLETLDLSNNHLSGGIPRELSNMSSLHTLDLSNNHLSGGIPRELSNMSSLHSLDLSDNHLLGGIPHELNNMSKLQILDLSDNQLSGEIPHDLSNMSSLQTLDFSANQLSGKVPEGIFRVSDEEFLLMLNDNNLTGRLPSNIFNTSIVSLDISDNHLVGTIPNLTKNLSRLEELSMSNNHFEGSIPLGLAEIDSLNYLDLSQNNLIGPVPSFENSFVRFIHLNNNYLSGLSKRMFNGNNSLLTLDLSYNEIANSIQDMIQDLSGTGLNILLLKGNHFSGDIPRQLCQLTNLTILDLSHNNFSGVIPNCLGKMPFEDKNPRLLYYLFRDIIPPGVYASPERHSPNVQEKANFTSKKRTETYMAGILAFMSGIDLSHNKLMGNIPIELGNLTRIRSLNLSHNDFTGQIPATFSNLEQTESLDLSFNKLSGLIPPQLTELTFLAVFSVAHNNLSGATPERKGQFSTFEESSYEGNLFLCGPPLPKSCNPPNPNDSNIDEANGSLVDMYVFYVSFAVSYTSALLVTAATLYINPYWRQAWFYYIELVSLNCYYFIKDNLCKLF